MAACRILVGVGFSSRQLHEPVLGPNDDANNRRTKAARPARDQHEPAGEHRPVQIAMVAVVGVLQRARHFRQGSLQSLAIAALWAP